MPRETLTICPDNGVLNNPHLENGHCFCQPRESCCFCRASREACISHDPTSGTYEDITRSEWWRASQPPYSIVIPADQQNVYVSSGPTFYLAPEPLYIINPLNIELESDDGSEEMKD